MNVVADKVKFGELGTFPKAFSQERLPKCQTSRVANFPSGKLPKWQTSQVANFPIGKLP